MKLSKIKGVLRSCLLVVAAYTLPLYGSLAQNVNPTGKADGAVEDTTAPAPVKKAFAKNTFGGNFIIDNQTVMVPPKNTLEFSIQHRFGIVNNGYQDFYGMFAPANIRLGINYAPINNLQIGIGICKIDMLVDGTVKYALVKQGATGGSPVSVTVFEDMAVSTIKAAGNFVNNSDRVSYFTQLMIARKVTKHFSVQVAGSLSYFNNIAGYVAADGTIQPTMKNSNFSFSALGRYMFTDGFGIIANYDQPLTQNTTNNPHPNVSFGIELSTTGHTFQIFASSCNGIVPQYNNVFNQVDFTKGQFLIGFNITRRWYH